MLNVCDQLIIDELLDSGEFIFFKWENRPKWSVAFVSENTEHILGYTPESFRSGSVSYSEIIHPDDLSMVISEVKSYSEDNQDHFIHKPYRIIKKDGSIIWIYDSSRIIYDSNGDVTHYVGYIMDITPLKEREILLQKRTQNLESEINKQTKTILELNTKLKEDAKIQKTLYEELFNSTKDGIVIFKDKSIIEHNRAIIKMMKCDSKDVLQDLFCSFFKKNNPIPMTKMFHCASNDGLCRFDWQVELSNKETLWTEVTLTPMKIQKETVMHSHWRDITRRKELEQINKEKTHQLIQQSRFAQMGEMISMIAHQWRQPLSVISSIVSAMQMKTELGLDKCCDSKEIEDNMEYLLSRFDKISNNVQYMSQTIDDFRYFFQPNKKATHFYLSDAFEHALSMLKQNLIDKNIDIKLNLGNHKPIYSYENEVIQVLINLLKNAKDALVENRVESPIIDIVITSLDNRQAIKVTDNAGGIKEDILEIIFDPYFSTKSKNGTGLGLYMSKTIIEEHCRGKIKVINSDNGACFEIMLPVSIEGETGQLVNNLF